MLQCKLAAEQLTFDRGMDLEPDLVKRCTHDRICVSQELFLDDDQHRYTEQMIGELTTSRKRRTSKVSALSRKGTIGSKKRLNGRRAYSVHQDQT